MTVDEFCQAFPQYAFDLGRPLAGQPRIVESALLDQVPVELTPEHPYRSGGRGRPNLNQTLTHSQCATCGRVLRNDLFHTPPTLLRRNVVYTHCRDCVRQINAAHYDRSATVVHARREAILGYLAPRCVICGFDRHPSALDLHHTAASDAVIAELVTALTLSPDVMHAEALLRGMDACVPLCSNCHRMVHAGILHLPSRQARPTYGLAELMHHLLAP